MNIINFCFDGSVVSSLMAYIGPGFGAGVIATVIGVLGACFLAVAGLVYYPIKRMVKQRKKSWPNDDKS